MSELPLETKRINVLEVIGNAIVGGMETYVTRLLEQLPSERFSVMALCPFESHFTDNLRQLDAEVLVAPMPEDPLWSSIQLGCTLVRTRAIDVLHAHLSNAHLLAGIIGRITGTPVLATIHGRQLNTIDVEIHRTTGTHLSVVCKHAYFHAMGLGVHPSQLHCIANGVDTRRFAPRSSRDAALRERWSVPKGAPLVGFVGRLSPEKGPEVFLRVARVMQHLAPEVHFVMVGEGPMRADLCRFIEQYGLTDRVRLVGLHEDMPQVYAELDVLLSTSHTEAMPFALMEAMACGVPVIGTRVGGVPDLIQHGQTGWLISPGADQEAAQRLTALLSSKVERERMGRLGRLRCAQSFSSEVSCTAMASLFSSLVPARETQRRIGQVGPATRLARGKVSPT